MRWLVFGTICPRLKVKIHWSLAKNMNFYPVNTIQEERLEGFNQTWSRDSTWYVDALIIYLFFFWLNMPRLKIKGYWSWPKFFILTRFQEKTPRQDLIKLGPRILHDIKMHWSVFCWICPMWKVKGQWTLAINMILIKSMWKCNFFIFITTVFCYFDNIV